MEVEPKQESDVKEYPKKQPIIIRKDNLIATFKALVTFMVKQFSFDCIPLGQQYTIYTNDPSSNLKNQIQFYCQILMQNFSKVYRRLKIIIFKYLGINSYDDAFTFLIESSTQIPKLRAYCEELIEPILDLKDSDFSQSFDKEFMLKKGKPLYFDPDFNGIIRQDLSTNFIMIEIEWQTFKEKIYPLVIISSIRKFVRMLLKVQYLFNVLYYKDPRKIMIRARVDFQYNKNQMINEVQDTGIDKPYLNIKIQFNKQNATKMEPGLM